MEGMKQEKTYLWYCTDTDELIEFKERPLLKAEDKPHVATVKFGETEVYEFSSTFYFIGEL